VPSELPPAPRWRNRADAFVEVWEEVCELLKVSAGLEAKTVFEYLQRRYAVSLRMGSAHVAASDKDLAGDGGASQGSIFRTTTPTGPLGCVRLYPHGGAGCHPPRAELSAPDLSLRADVFELGSGDGVLLGELRKPVRRAAERGVETGKVPQRHRTDRLSTAVNNASDRAEFTERYQGLMRHYGLEGKRRKPGMGMRTATWSSGTIASNGRWRKNCCCAAVGTSPAWQPTSGFTRVVRALERRTQAPAGGRDEGDAGAAGTTYGILQAGAGEVDSGSLIYVDRNVYSVPSRLIGEQVEARLYMDHIEVWYGQKRWSSCSGYGGGRSIGWTIATSSTG